MGGPNDRAITPPKGARRGVLESKDNEENQQHNAQTVGPARPFIRVGMQVDCKDSYNYWLTATIVEISPQRKSVLIHFNHWPSHQWDTWYPWDSDLIQPRGTWKWVPNTPNKDFKVGQWLDVLDVHPSRPIPVWTVARVVEVFPAPTTSSSSSAAAAGEAGAGSTSATSSTTMAPFSSVSRIRIHYRGYSNDLDEWLSIPRDTLPPNQRIAEYETRTRKLFSYVPAKQTFWTGRERKAIFHSDTDPRLVHYLTSLASRGLRLRPMGGDGNCLFRSVADQIYGNQEHHAICRAAAADYMEAERSFFSGFVGHPEGFEGYIEEIRKVGTWGDDPEIQALGELYNRPVEIWAYDAVEGAKPIRVFHGGLGGGGGGGQSQPSSSSSNSSSSSSVSSFIPGGDQNSGSSSSSSSSRASSTSSLLSSSSTLQSSAAVIRLSYYGGGHYDSLEGSGWRENFSTNAVGQREEQIVNIARIRNLPGGNAAMVASVGEAAATEASAMAAALAASRALLEESQNDSIEAALFASLGLDVNVMRSLQGGGGGGDGNSAVLVGAGRGGGSGSSSSSGFIDLTGMDGSGGVMDEATMMNLALQRSAQENNLNTNVNNDEDEAMKAAMRASLLVAFGDDEAGRAAAAFAAAEAGISSAGGSAGSSSRGGGGGGGGTGGGVATHLSPEEEMMETARRASLLEMGRGRGGGGGVESSGTMAMDAHSSNFDENSAINTGGVIVRTQADTEYEAALELTEEEQLLSVMMNISASEFLHQKRSGLLPSVEILRAMLGDNSTYGLGGSNMNSGSSSSSSSAMMRAGNTYNVAGAGGGGGRGDGNPMMVDSSSSGSSSTSAGHPNTQPMQQQPAVSMAEMSPEDLELHLAILLSQEMQH